MRLPPTVLGAIALTAGLATAGSADTIYLANGEEMKGLIVKETAAAVELDIGYGTVTLDRAQIRRIARPPKKKRAAADLGHRLRFLESGRWVPPEGRDLFDLYKDASDARHEALELKPKFERLMEERSDLVRELQDVNEAGAQTYEELTDGQDYADRQQRSRAAAELRRLSGDMNQGVSRVRAIDAEIAESAQALPRYYASYRRFQRAAKDEAPRLAKAAKTKDDKAFYDAIAAAMRQMDSDFGGAAETGRPLEGHVIVDVLFNGRVKAQLMVDTGASMTVVSESIVRRLGLSERHSAGRRQVQVADGRIVETQTYNLDTVAVGDKKAQGVLIASIQDGALPYDGLLGMSFLKNFLVELDPKRGRLVLKALN
ncbi:hypothetical protein EPO15_17875 [bacterium]|nr:MAG: hypothetical protein EPO15_17875 [bacterium]